jgi:hypothetical protein
MKNWVSNSIIPYYPYNKCLIRFMLDNLTWTVRIKDRMTGRSSLERRSIGSPPEHRCRSPDVGASAGIPATTGTAGSGASASSTLPDILEGSGFQSIGATTRVFVCLFFAFKTELRNLDLVFATKFQIRY